MKGDQNSLFLLQSFVRLDHIKKCFTQKGGIFVLEEFGESKSGGEIVLVVSTSTEFLPHRSEDQARHGTAVQLVDGEYRECRI